MADQPETDENLMLRVKDGDLRAFEAIVEKYKRPILNMIFRTLRDANEAEDLAQVVFIQAHKSAAGYKATAKLGTWLFTIARNLCLNELRRRSRHPADSLDGMSTAGEQHPAMLFKDQDLSYEEIAAVLGCSVSATKSLIHRAREALKLRLKPYLSTGEWRR
jgi:RNA polymerase sigma-70 factor (ECF subfamily)